MRKRRVLIVSPHFPPVNAPDMQRARMSLPYFAQYGWEASVLAVRPDSGQIVEPLLVETIPRDTPVARVNPAPLTLSRAVGIGNVALRALPALYRRGRRLIEDQSIDLVYFSTTMF